MLYSILFISLSSLHCAWLGIKNQSQVC